MGNVPSQTEDQNLIIPVRLTNKQEGILPVRSTSGAAGFDLASPFDHVLDPGRITQVPLGFSLCIPKGHVGKIEGRSSLALKYGIQILGGVIDSDYRGDVAVILRNSGTVPFEFKRGERIAQMVILRLSPASQVVQVEELDDTERGKDGFGSTGK
jgi:dUTP pyrophosphatase